MPVYLDHAATTPLRPEVLEAMTPYLRGVFGNASSGHVFGRAAREALDDAHERLARAIGGEAREIVFTSGGTEADNLALKGAAWAGKSRGHRIVTTAVEHHAVADTLAHLEHFGFEVVRVGVDRYGRVDPAEVEAALTERTTLVSVMLANNEVGTVQPVADIAGLVRARRGILLHVDAVQAAPWVDLDVASLGADLVALSAHKAEGPKGTGALWIRRGTHILAQQHGGSQERHRRAGTENVAGAVGMATAFELAAAERATTTPRVRALRDRLGETLAATDGVELTGHPAERLPHILSVTAHGLDGPSAMQALDLAGIAVATGSACTTGSADPSHVLTAMGFPADEARGALRFSLGRTTTAADIDEAVRVVPGVLGRLLAARPAPVTEVAAG
ncbi:MAG TPA: cysteine desulfurase family protein [Candidatus Limnocylindrales bacterium]|nr:cysteine desulfurase family protein [Candidatus Limnocylindrales bacterium]